MRSTDAHAGPTHRREPTMTTAVYTVKGLTCGYGIAEVMEHVRHVVGVTVVEVDRTGEWAGGSDKHTARVADSPSVARRPNDCVMREGVRSWVPAT